MPTAAAWRCTHNQLLKSVALEREICGRPRRDLPFLVCRQGLSYIEVERLFTMDECLVSHQG